MLVTCVAVSPENQRVLPLSHTVRKMVWRLKPHVVTVITWFAAEHTPCVSCCILLPSPGFIVTA